ncbi:MAG: PHP domain-containing protein [Christensenellales bacterium]
MRLIADLHTHSVYSRNGHGKGTVFENVQAAVALGLEEVAITDHGLAHHFFGVRRSQLSNLRRDIRQAEKAFEGRIRVLMGVEANLLSLDGTTDLDQDLMDRLDIIVMGYHRGVRMKSLRDFFAVNVRGLLPFMRREAFRERVTDAYMAALERYPINIWSHPGEYIPVNMKRAAPVAARRGTLIEINQRHPMDLDSLRAAQDAGAKFVVSSDAHRPDRVGHVERALQQAQRAGIDPGRIVNIEA